MKNILMIALSAFAITFAAGCGVDIESGAQGAGQRCFFPSDCASGLTCYQRVCTPIATTNPNNANNANNVNNENNVNNINNENNVNNQFDMGFDLGGNCSDGQRLCVDEVTRAICVEEEWIIERCDGDLFCSQGDCTPINMCTDRDGDGYGNGCPRGPDCDDRDATVFPDQPENCNTRVDDNCNGEVNEGCGLCCPGGCGDDEFCNGQCVCAPFDQFECQFQNQPCVNEGSFDNGFFCASIDGQSSPRCYGTCVGNDNNTCPESGSVCSFGDQNQGVCFSSCNFAQGCGDPGLGCLPFGDSPQDGMCVPVTPNGEGDRCDQNQFFDCAEGLLCVDLGNGSRCREVCRPFEFVGTPTTDCGSGHCIAFSSDLGICRPDNNSFEGDSCSPQFTTCNEDAVGCYQGQQGNQCSRLCRIAEGDRDCVDGACQQFSPDQNEIGVCF